MTFRFLLSAVKNEGKTTTGHVVRRIELRFDRGSRSWISQVDWAAFSRTASAFPLLDRITVVVDDGSEEMDVYMQNAHEHLETLARERGLQLKINEYW